MVAGWLLLFPLSHSLPQDIFGLEFLMFLEGKSGTMTMAVLCSFIFALYCMAGFTRMYKRYGQHAVALTVTAIFLGGGALLMFLRIIVH
jgi:hypothetical protein